MINEEAKSICVGDAEILVARMKDTLSYLERDAAMFYDLMEKAPSVEQRDFFEDAYWLVDTLHHDCDHNLRMFQRHWSGLIEEGVK